MKSNSKDERFAKAFQDHRFRPIRQRTRKIQIDKRFQSMFTDKKFKVSYTHDKRGRPIKESSSENLKRYYQLSHEEKKRIKLERQNRKQVLAKKLADEEEEEKSEHSDEEEQKKTVNDVSDVSSSEESDSSDDDLARGRGNESSSSDDSEEEEEEFNRFHDSVTVEHQWGELDGTAPRSDDVSKRLALCNMDWDRIKLKDVMVVMNSFKPTGGNIDKISLYLSDFGKERIEEENQFGPAELREAAPTGANAIPIGQALPDNKFEERFQTEKLRKYQLNRLKYYFIVIECDTTATAEHIYNECDGREFETSCSRMDLRFIPDETSFEERTSKEVITSMPDLTSYEPSDFTTSALNQTKVQLTWDETNFDRTKVTMRKFNKDELENMDVQDFLASSSGSDDEEQPASNIEEVKKFSSDKERIAHFRSLLLGKEDGSGSDNDVDMEVTWEPSKIKQHDGSSGEEEEDQENEESGEENDEEEQKQKSELELILMEDDNKGKQEKHFNMDEIVENHKLKIKQRKKRKKKDEDIEEDDFKIDVDDNRFSALYTSGKYNIDKSNPKYRKTEAMETLVHERQKRVKKAKPETYERLVIKTATPATSNDEISALIKSIKAKTSVKTKKMKNKS